MHFPLELIPFAFSSPGPCHEDLACFDHQENFVQGEKEEESAMKTARPQTGEGLLWKHFLPREGDDLQSFPGVSSGPLIPGRAEYVITGTAKAWWPRVLGSQFPTVLLVFPSPSHAKQLLFYIHATHWTAKRLKAYLIYLCTKCSTKGLRRFAKPHTIEKDKTHSGQYQGRERWEGYL